MKLDWLRILSIQIVQDLRLRLRLKEIGGILHTAYYMHDMMMLHKVMELIYVPLALIRIIIKGKEGERGSNV